MLNDLFHTMKKLGIMLLASISLLQSCGDSKKPQEQSFKDTGKLTQLNLPEWVVDPSIEGKIAAVGIAPKTVGGIKMQIAQAESDAVANMAAQIQTSVSRITKESMRRAGVSTEVKSSEAVDQYFAQATKNVVKDVPISGAKRKNIYQSPSDGTLYIQMVIEPTAVKEYLISMADDLAKGMKDFGVTQKTIAQTENTMKDLFTELDTSAKPTEEKK
jgi:hypothetical protein